MNRKLKIVSEGIDVDAKRAIVPPGCENKPRRWVCPKCHKESSRRKPVADLIQYGFEWDSYITVMGCSCGQQYFSEYNIWHAGEEN